MKYFSMFSGIGGFEYGIGEKGQCIGYSEIDKYAEAIYQYHYPSHINWGDAREINTSQLEDFHLLVAGFPCQAFSVAGKREGFRDTRGTLFFEIARVLKDKRPPYFLLENVAGLLSHEEGETFQTILEVLTKIGYRVEWQVLNSKDFGVPQNRERVFIAGHLTTTGGGGGTVFPITNSGGKNLEELTEQSGQADRVYDVKGVAPTVPTSGGGRHEPKILAKCLDANYYKGIDNHGQRTAIPVLTPEREKKRQMGRRFKTNGEPAFACTSQDQHGVYDGVRVRRLTPVECERLQGFPDDYTKYGVDGGGGTVQVSDTQRYKCLGNAVTTNVITAIIENWSSL